MDRRDFLKHVAAAAAGLVAAVSDLWPSPHQVASAREITQGDFGWHGLLYRPESFVHHLNVWTDQPEAERVIVDFLRRDGSLFQRFHLNAGSGISRISSIGLGFNPPESDPEGRMPEGFLIRGKAAVRVLGVWDDGTPVVEEYQTDGPPLLILVRAASFAQMRRLNPPGSVKATRTVCYINGTTGRRQSYTLTSWLSLFS